jgi:hypothetical protein
MSKKGMTKSEHKFYSGMKSRLERAIDEMNSNRKVSKEKANNLYLDFINTKTVNIPKHHPFKRVNK